MPILSFKILAIPSGIIRLITVGIRDLLENLGSSLFLITDGVLEWHALLIGARHGQRRLLNWMRVDRGLCIKNRFIVDHQNLFALGYWTLLFCSRLRWLIDSHQSLQAYILLGILIQNFARSQIDFIYVSRRYLLYKLLLGFSVWLGVQERCSMLYFHWGEWARL